MDAVKFIKESCRMCRTYGNCNGCPFNGERCVNLLLNLECSVETFVEKVEKWSEEHPFITNLIKFEEIFGRDIQEVKASRSWWSKEYKEPLEEE